ncbi:MAG: FIST C-terminal domain-containing protein [Candidatus Latescibacterota bacterium]|nr:MAG: FIST C-terminal domain-containing protein [Candidatus Latescibacterota bacterium]
MKFVSAISTETSASAAIREAALRVKNEFEEDTIDLALVFVSPHFVDDAGVVVKTIQEELGPRVLAGCSGEGVIGPEQEIEQKPAVSLTAARLPGVDIFAHGLRASDLHKAVGGGVVFPREVNVPKSPTLFLMMADPFSTAMDHVLRVFNALYAPTPIIGGMASASRTPGGNALFINKDFQNDGAVVIAFSGEIDIDIVVSQGCRPIGPTFGVTSARDNAILDLEGTPPLQQLEKIVGGLSEEERNLLRNGLFIGRAVDPGKDMLGRGDFLIRGVIGVEPENGTITIGDFVDNGDVVQFHLRDAATATEDLEMMLTPHGLFGPPSGAFLFSCNGRGTRLYDHPNGDVSVIQRFFPGLSVAGFFCAGEIGPIGGKNFLHGHTASLVLFRPRAKRGAGT